MVGPQAKTVGQRIPMSLGPDCLSIFPAQPLARSSPWEAWPQSMCMCGFQRATTEVLTQLYFSIRTKKRAAEVADRMIIQGFVNHLKDFILYSNCRGKPAENLS